MFFLLEMMMVVTLILIVASISAPVYLTSMVRAHEAVLRGWRIRPDGFCQDVCDPGTI
jgi:type II secretory pathway pseudopilin PulG